MHDLLVDDMNAEGCDLAQQGRLILPYFRIPQLSSGNTHMYTCTGTCMYRPHLHCRPTCIRSRMSIFVLPLAKGSPGRQRGEHEKETSDTGITTTYVAT